MGVTVVNAKRHSSDATIIGKAWLAANVSIRHGAAFRLSRVLPVLAALLCPGGAEAHVEPVVPSAFASFSFPPHAILYTILFLLCCLLLIVLLRMRHLKGVLATYQGYAEHVRMLRDIMTQSAESQSEELAVHIAMGYVARTFRCSMVVARISNATIGPDATRIHWFFNGADDTPELREAVTFALESDYMNGLSDGLFLPEVASYPTLFNYSGAVRTAFRSGCMVPHRGGSDAMLLAAFFGPEVEVPPQEGQMQMVEQLDLAGFALFRLVGRMRVERYLEQQRDMHRALFEDVALAFVVADPETGRVVMVNKAAEELFGMGTDVMRRIQLWQLHASGERGAKGLYRQAMRAGGLVFEMRYLSFTGGQRDLEVHAAPVMLDGEPRLLACYYDISLRKSAELSLSQSEQRLRNLVERAPMALALSEQRCRLLYVNPAFASLLGYQREELVGKNFKTLLQENCREDFLEFQQRFMQESTHAISEWTLLRKDGDMRRMQLNCFIMSGMDGLPQVAMFMQDITDRQRLEDMMIQSEKMASVGGLAAGMAHEINNPLGGILQGCQNIRRRLDPLLLPNQRAADAVGVQLNDVVRYLEERNIMRFFEGIRESAERAAQITANMLNFSRRGNWDYAPRSINELIEAALALIVNDYDLNKRYDFKKISVVREYTEDMPPVLCVPTEIEQVTLNLLKNAAQAMGEATPPIARPSIVVRTYVKDHMGVFEVEDNGPGMPKHVARRVFEPFYTTKRAGSGTGLGLAVSYFIITNNHKGTVELDSVPGRGTKFTVSLPLQRPTVA